MKLKNNILISTLTKYFIALLFLVVYSSDVLAQANGDYQTNGVGTSWTNPAHWDKRVAGAWVAGVDSPGDAAMAAGSTVTIQDGHTMDLDMNVTANPLVHLVIGGGVSGAYTCAGTQSLTLTGNLTINTGATMTVQRTTLIVNGTTTVTGTMNDGHNTGSMRFDQTVTVTGNMSLANNSNVTFRGGLTNTGGTVSFTGTKTITFDTNPQDIAGNAAISFGTGNSIVVTGITVTNKNTAGVSILRTNAGALSGTGGWTQSNTAGVGSVLNYYGSTLTITTYDFSSNPNTVDYAAGAAQTIDATFPNYYNLKASGSNTKTLENNITVANNLDINGTATLASDRYQITGNATGTLSMAAGGILTLGNTGQNDGIQFPTLYATFAFTAGATVVYQENGAQTVAAIAYPNLQLITSGTKTLAGNIAATGNLTITTATFDINSRAVTFGGTATIAGGLNISTGSLGVTSTITHSSGTVAISSIGSLSTSSSYTLSGTGVLSIGAGSVSTNTSMTSSSSVTPAISISTGSLSTTTSLAISAGSLEISSSGTVTTTTTFNISGTAYAYINAGTGTAGTSMTLTSNAAPCVRITTGTLNVNGGNLVNTGTGNPAIRVTSTGKIDLADARSYTSTGSLTFDGAGFFEIGGGWSNNGAFTEGTSTVTFNAVSTANYTINSQSETFYNLTLNHTVSTDNFEVTDGTTLTVTGVFTHTSGDFDLDLDEVFNVTGAGAHSIAASGRMLVRGATSTATFSGVLNIAGILTVGAGSDVDVATLTMSGSGNISISGAGSTVDVSVSTSMTGSSYIDGTDNNGVLNLATFTMAGSSYVGGNNGGRTFDINCTSLQVSNGATCLVEDCDFTNSGATNIYGSLDFTDATGTKTLTGDVTIYDAGGGGPGTWNSSGNGSFSLAGSLTNNGTFTSGTGTYTFSGAAKSLSASSGSLTFSGIVSISGTYTNTVTTLNILDDLAGAGSLTNQANKTLKIGDDCTITTLVATANPNTVEYNGSTGQVVKATDYHHLIINNSVSTSNMTMGTSATTAVAGDLTISGGELFPGTGTVLNVTGTTTVSSNGSIYYQTDNTGDLNLGALVMSAGTITHSTNGSAGALDCTTLSVPSGSITINRVNLTVTGATTIDGTIDWNETDGTKDLTNVTVNGTWQSTAGETFNDIANLTLASGSTFTCGAGDYYIAGDLTVDNACTYTAGTGDFYFTGAAKLIQATGGRASFTFGDDVSVSGTVTNSIPSIIVTDNLTGAGSWAHGANTLYIGGDCDVTTLDVNDVGCTVEYNGPNGVTQYMKGGIAAPGQEYYNLVLNRVTGTDNVEIVIGEHVNVLNNLTITSGDFIIRTNSDLTVAGTTTISGNGYLRFGTDATGDAILGPVVLDGGQLGGANTGDITCTTITSNVGTTSDINDCILVASGATVINGTVDLSATGGTKSFLGAFTVAATGSFTNTGLESVTFGDGAGDDWTLVNGGTVNTTAGTYTFAGGTAGSHATIDCSGCNSLTFGNNATFNGYYDNDVETLTFSGNLAGTGSFTNKATMILQVGGDATITTLTATAANNTVKYIGTTTQDVSTVGSYYNLTINNTGGAGTDRVRFSTDQVVANALYIQDGSLEVNGGGSNLTGAATVTMDAGTAWYLDTQSGVTIPEITGVYTLAAGTTISFERGANQDISGRLGSTNASYQNVAFENSNTKTIQSDLYVDGDLTITGTAALDVKNASNYAVYVKGNWTVTSTAANPFVERSGTVVFNGAGGTSVISTVLAGGETFNGLTKNGTSVLQLSSAVIVSTTLTMFAGNINGNGNTLTLGNGTGATLSLTAGVFYGGTFKRWFPVGPITLAGTNYGTFPLGISTGDDRRVTVETLSDITVAGYLETYHTDAADATSVTINDGGVNIEAITNMSFTLTRTGGVLTKQAMGLKGNDHLLAGQFYVSFYHTQLNAGGALTDMRMTKDGAAAPGAHTGAAGSVPSPIGRRTTLTAANLDGVWKLGTSNWASTPLPVTLTALTAKPKGDIVDVNWKTLSETNSDYFDVERSNDGGITYQPIGRVTAAGNSSSNINYMIEDNQPAKGINYYRLIQVDNDGKKVVYGPVAVEMNTSRSVTDLQVFPNPVEGNEFSIGLHADQTQEVLIVVRDVLGNEVYYNVSVVNAGNNIFVVNTDERFVSGVYYVITSYNNVTSTKKIIVK